MKASEILLILLASVTLITSGLCQDVDDYDYGGEFRLPCYCVLEASWLTGVYRNKPHHKPGWGTAPDIKRLNISQLDNYRITHTNTWLNNPPYFAGYSRRFSHVRKVHAIWVRDLPSNIFVYLAGEKPPCHKDIPNYVIYDVIFVPKGELENKYRVGFATSIDPDIGISCVPQHGHVRYRDGNESFPIENFPGGVYFYKSTVLKQEPLFVYWAGRGVELSEKPVIMVSRQFLQVDSLTEWQTVFTFYSFRPEFLEFTWISNNDTTRDNFDLENQGYYFCIPGSDYFRKLNPVEEPEIQYTYDMRYGPVSSSTPVEFLRRPVDEDDGFLKPEL